MRSCRANIGSGPGPCSLPILAHKKVHGLKAMRILPRASGSVARPVCKSNLDLKFLNFVERSSNSASGFKLFVRACSTNDIPLYDAFRFHCRLSRGIYF